MEKSPPSAKSLKDAWEAGQRVRNPSALETETLVLALLHGVGMGAARAPKTLQEGTEGPHLQTARLFVALQVKLAHESQCLERVPAAWFEQLLAGIPKSWAHALQARLLRPEPGATAPAVVARMTRRDPQRLPVALADMEAMGRA